MSKSDMSNLSVLDLQVLWQISLKPIHAYSLLKVLGEKRGKKITSGALFPVLKKFKDKKYIKARKAGKREKIVYEITAKGRKALKGSCNDFVGLFDDIFKKYSCIKCGEK